MGRVLLALLSLAPAALLLIPPEDPARAAALRSWPAHGSGDFASCLPLAEAVLGGPAVGAADGRRVLRLGGVRFSSDQPTEDLTLHLVARGSIARGLREATADLGQPLSVEGDLMPVKGGADFLVEHREGELSVSYAHPETGAVVRAAHAAPERRTLLGRSPWLWVGALGCPLFGVALLLRRPAGPAAGT